MGLKHTLPSSEELHADFEYNPETGVLLRKPRPRSRFNNEWVFASWNSRYGGKPAGSTGGDDYIVVKVVGIKAKSVRIPAHHVIWKMVTGKDTEHFIDHINCDKKDNRWSNLREATNLQNATNRGKASHNTSGLKGVSFLSTKFNKI